MKRRAILVAAGNATGSDRLEGPGQDVRRLRRWLESSRGGAWEEDEILDLSDPSSDRVQSAVRAAGDADYAFVSFSGHGWIAEEAGTGKRVQKIVLGTGESVDFASLRPVVRKATMLCDACREVVVLKYFKEARGAGRMSLVEDTRERVLCRALFDGGIRAAGEGAFWLWGCSVGEYSYEHPLEGGFFTGALIDSAAEWANAPRAGIPFTVDQVLAAAKAVVQARTAGRTPCQNPGGGPENRALGNRFPFAVSPE